MALETVFSVNTSFVTTGVVKHYTNLCVDVIKLYSYMHLSKNVNLNEPAHQKTLGKIATSLHGGA